MKTLKLIPLLFVVFISQTVYSQVINTKSIQVTANKMTNRIKVEANLNDSQIVIINKSALLFLQNYDKTYQNKSDSAQSTSMTAYKFYKQTIDSVLTPEQKKKLIQKKNERMETAKESYYSKKK